MSTTSRTLLAVLERLALSDDREAELKNLAAEVRHCMLCCVGLRTVDGGVLRHLLLQYLCRHDYLALFRGHVAARCALMLPSGK